MPITAGTAQPLIVHLKELRRRLIISSVYLLAGTIFCWIFYEKISSLLLAPFAQLDGIGSQKLFVTSLFEGFLVRIKTAFLCGVILTLPVHLYQLTAFVFPGLKKRERQVIVWGLIASMILAAGAIVYGYRYVVPLTIKTMTTSAFIPQGVGAMLGFEQNVFYVFNFLMWTVLVFQLPIILEALLFLNVIRRTTLLHYWRHALVVIFIIAAVATPPDWVSQLGVALPLVLLYFLVILIARIFRFGD